MRAWAESCRSLVTSAAPGAVAVQAGAAEAATHTEPAALHNLMSLKRLDPDDLKLCRLHAPRPPLLLPVVSDRNHPRRLP